MCLEEGLRYGLILLLVLNCVGLVFTSLINLEAFFFGNKLTGETAAVYLSLSIIAALLIAYSLFKKMSVGPVLSLLYFGFLFFETLTTNLLYNFGFYVSPLFTLGLICSIFLLLIERMVSVVLLGHS